MTTAARYERDTRMTRTVVRLGRSNYGYDEVRTKEEDPSGLLNEGFRYRDLETGEFITRDPAGFINGPNLYTYVRQNPWTKFDPEGLAEVTSEQANVLHESYKQAIDNNYKSQNFVMRAVSQVFGIHDRFQRMNDEAYSNALKTGDYHVGTGQAALESVAAGADTYAKTVAIAASAGALAGGVTAPRVPETPPQGSSPSGNTASTNVANSQAEAAKAAPQAEWSNPISAKPGQTQTIDPASVKAGEQTALSESRIANQKSLIESGTPRTGGPPQVNEEGVIVDGHHALRAASEMGQTVQVRVVRAPEVTSATNKPITKLPTYQQ